MRITEQAAELLRRIADGDCVVDLGQISAATLRTFKRMTERGQLVRAVYIGFPKAKKAWIGAGLPREEWPAHCFECDPRNDRRDVQPIANDNFAVAA